MVVPQDKTFLVMPTTFNGPCRFDEIIVQIAGTMVAPNDPITWNGIDASTWLKFQSVSKLSITGFGEINGRGQDWWKQSCRNDDDPGCTTTAPTAVKLINCNDLHLSSLNFVDSAQVHLLIVDSLRVNVTNLTIVAPEASPNTDGIHIEGSQHVLIKNSTIQTGDDCISIGNNVNDIHANGIVCGPGHGISIGSLGWRGSAASVENVIVKNSSFIGTSNGVRIKTWTGGRGFARGIRFDSCNFTNVKNPIIINQYYCDKNKERCKIEATDVQISNVTYANMQGTSLTRAAISLNCSQSIPCTLLEFDNINIQDADPQVNATAFCINAHGVTNGDINPVISCLLP